LVIRLYTNRFVNRVLSQIFHPYDQPKKSLQSMHFVFSVLRRTPSYSVPTGWLWHSSSQFQLLSSSAMVSSECAPWSACHGGTRSCTRNSWSGWLLAMREYLFSKVKGNPSYEY
jgi:hypothetical protein